MMTVNVLGPLEVSVRGRPVRLSAPKPRILLVVLAMAGGASVSVDRLAAALWNDDLPEHPRRAVQTYLTRLRDAVGKEMIVAGPAGYRLRLEPDEVDALRFEHLLARAATAPDPVSERALLDTALSLWRGDPFDGIRADWANGVRARLVERYLCGAERRADLDLAGGRTGEVIVRLRELTAAHPLRESLRTRLMTALVAAGRRAEALAEYESARRQLTTELGVDPGPELRHIHADLHDRGQPVRSSAGRGRDQDGTARHRQRCAGSEYRVAAGAVLGAGVEHDPVRRARAARQRPVDLGRSGVQDDEDVVVDPR